MFARLHVRLSCHVTPSSNSVAAPSLTEKLNPALIILALKNDGVTLFCDTWRRSIEEEKTRFADAVVAPLLRKWTTTFPPPHFRLGVLLQQYVIQLVIATECEWSCDAACIKLVQWSGYLMTSMSTSLLSGLAEAAATLLEFQEGQGTDHRSSSQSKRCITIHGFRIGIKPQYSTSLNCKSTTFSREQ